MLTSVELRERLPRLRRHAYLLTGNRHSADEAVMACLAALPRDTAGKPCVADDKALFRTFHSAVLAPTEPVAGPDAACEADADLAETRDRLFALPPLERRVILLVSLEGFTMSEASAILCIERARAARALLSARSLMVQPQRRLRAMIIEDDQLIGMDIAESLQEMGYGDCVYAANGREALEAFGAGEPDLIIADVVLSDGPSGVEVARRLRGRYKAPVVFVTAFPEMALADPSVTADRVLPKPFSPSALKSMVRRTLEAPAA